MAKRDLLTIADLTKNEIIEIFKLASKFKNSSLPSPSRPLKGKNLALLFEKPSLRTRLSFEVGINQLGGHSVYLGPEEVGLGKRESVKDVGRVLCRYVHGIIARVFSHKDLTELAKYSSVPVINALSDLCHPCQILSDIHLIKEKKGELKGLKVAFLGDGSNNVAHSWVLGAAKMGINLVIASPEGYGPQREIVKAAGEILVTTDVKEAAKRADVLYTDVWTSMGQEEEAEKRKKIFADYQINRKVLDLAKKECLLMHCLPAHRGQEVTCDVLEGGNSIIFEQAENRLHLQKALLVFLLQEN